MRILCIGDIVGKTGRRVVQECVPKLREEEDLDFVVANAENAAGGAGLTPKGAEQLLRARCDVLTLGDHAWDRSELAEYLDRSPETIRPANFPEGAPGVGWRVVRTLAGRKIGVVNLLGRVFMRHQVECPFRALERIAERIHRETPVILVDFHAETTSEKIAMGWFADGRVSAVFGTHTHVQTADETILPQGTGYITDLGMTGPHDSVIGQRKDKILRRFLTSLPERFEVAVDDGRLHGIILDVDETTGRTRRIERVQRRWP